jgi:hypothetical protein
MLGKVDSGPIEAARGRILAANRHRATRDMAVAKIVLRMFET